jgi:flagellar biosynthesis regulator FlaF
MKRLFDKDFWNTLIADLSRSDKRRAMLFFLSIVLVCIFIGGYAAWQIMKSQ